MRSATVFLNDVVVGHLNEEESGYSFCYDERFLATPDARPISLTLPLSSSMYQTAYLFAFFVGLLPEGYNRSVQCRLLKIDENDDFGLLLAVAHTDTIGAVRVVAAYPTGL
ncbi:HipA N-terminal domain-containing protein [Fibrella sp. HMF5335]|uniref:HipA N-terminal domain-containing protein n=1 Tax=Fibrella rubiginis TaxID=2817060 RepID=A0A939GHI5_9BACT|nr:HipA N-terminal domain-containing protein [Fibrella rubiginis]MBO0936573.1 HipA N-terminal domain-containing protein [Fibrella rubiginis]